MFQSITFLLCAHMAFPLCMEDSRPEKESDFFSFSSYKATGFIRLGSDIMTSFNFTSYSPISRYSPIVG